MATLMDTAVLLEVVGEVVHLVEVGVLLAIVSVGAEVVLVEADHLETGNVSISFLRKILVAIFRY